MKKLHIYWENDNEIITLDWDNTGNRFCVALKDNTRSYDAPPAHMRFKSFDDAWGLFEELTLGVKEGTINMEVSSGYSADNLSDSNSLHSGGEEQVSCQVGGTEDRQLDSISYCFHPFTDRDFLDGGDF